MQNDHPQKIPARCKASSGTIFCASLNLGRDGDTSAAAINMSDEGRLKILLVGPCKSGKSMIANYLAGVSQNLSFQGEYHSTVAVRWDFVRCIRTSHLIL